MPNSAKAGPPFPLTCTSDDRLLMAPRKKLRLFTGLVNVSVRSLVQKGSNVLDAAQIAFGTLLPYRLLKPQVLTVPLLELKVTPSLAVYWLVTVVKGERVSKLTVLANVAKTEAKNSTNVFKNILRICLFWRWLYKD